MNNRIFNYVLVVLLILLSDRGFAQNKIFDSVAIDKIRKVAGVGCVIVNKKTAQGYYGRFNKTIRKSKTPIQRGNLSKAVWLDTAAIRILADCVLDPNNKIDGVRVYMIAYNKKGSAPGQRKNKKHQASIIMVPTGRENSEVHRDNWTILRDKYSMLFSLLDNGGLNHGELCPEKCEGCELQY